MQRCLQLAKNGLGLTYPNPLVGCVIVHKDQIIGEGWHRKSGEPHAEIMAINAVKNKELLPNSTLYVNLEPCSHTGKTPPCAERIVSEKIPRVVIGSRDPALHVNGKGIQYLKDNNVIVTENILSTACEWLNRRFYCFHQKKRPYIIIKFAQTQNNFFAVKDDQQKWISNKFSKQWVHKMRTEEQAILVGQRTVEIDSPMLNARLWKGNNPIRIMISSRIDSSTKKFSEIKNSIIFNSEENITTENAEFIKLDFQKSIISQIMNYLYISGIQSLIVEGGAQTIQHFIDENMWDEARILIGNIHWPDGIVAPYFPKKQLIHQEFIAKDLLQIYIP
ncbi:MAG: bifunctional diaminohydroxyphosphoribosylaminopyrimidine deaminase/5-amino-6-(5-phosphoribosylamino)uracil reductase RibD [Flavobacteriaceae bacterium]|nr:bifunctional diaminohydroxyphosphoribosylaminopyrimidine deaminase/5-amino-6-(5-phosphoribosylamino)uracil reductase RibD [Flavobacteriaceae bacterium]